MLVPTKYNPNLNNGTLISNNIANVMSDGHYDGLDKSKSILGTTYDVINTTLAIADNITEASGARSPYYVIGEITEGGKESSWLPESINTPLRAITQRTKQEGVIIDCLGDIDGVWAVEFTQNPIFYGTSTATDSRVRVPTKLTAVVAISNYRTDSVIESLIYGLEKSVLGTDVLSNAFLYDGNTRAQQGLYRLIWLMENAEPFRVYTPHGIYDNMLIRNIKVETNDKTMDMLYATLAFEEVIMTRPYWNGQGTAPNIPARTALTVDYNRTLSEKWNALFGG